MAVVFSPNDNKITMPIGDTLTFPGSVKGEPFGDGDYVLFAVSDSDGIDIISKLFPIADGKFTVRLASADTASMEVGGYTWNLRLLHGAQVVNDKPQIDDNDEVMTVWNKPPKFILVDGGGDV